MSAQVRSPAVVCGKWFIANGGLRRQGPRRPAEHPIGGRDRSLLAREPGHANRVLEDLQGVLQIVLLTTETLRVLMNGILAPGQKLLRRFELDDAAAFAVLVEIALVGDETRHRLRKSQQS